MDKLKPLSKIEDLHEDDAQFVRDLMSLHFLYFDKGGRKIPSEGKAYEEAVSEFLGFLYEFGNDILIDRNVKGRICKLQLHNWFTHLLPYWIKRIVESKRIHGNSKNDIINSIDEFISHNLVVPDEIIPCENPMDDLPAWYLHVIPDSIGLLSELKFLNLKCNHLTAIPESMKNLGHLRELDLCFSIFNDLPDWLAELPMLERLDISCNPLQTVPKCVIKIAEKHYARFHKDVPHKEAIVLGILDILSGEILCKLEDDQFPDGDHAHNYRVNEYGHVSHIYLWEEDVLFEFFPEQLCELVHLEELHIVENAITSLPESLPKLKKLKVLNLWRDCIDIGRSEEFRIPESIFPFLRNLDRFIYETNVLKKLGLDKNE